LSAKSSNTAVAGIVISVIVIATVASVGYYQFNIAQPPDTATTTSAAAVCLPASCVLVNITSGASAGPQGAPGYSPDNITVVIGVNNTVQWTNQDAALHTVTGSGDFGSDPSGLSQGSTYVYQFTVPGVYPYKCIFHAWMHGSVTVVAGSTSTTSS